ncbi:ferredoxin [Enterococcus lactis]|uniref:ferredoxin n=1 Tax=Enterococcus lactis TaxID=357441 RepID=UPI00237C3B4D|nr:ferredoxin [Enterococcus lactis]
MSLLCKLVPERCIACGLCQIEAPDIFDYDEEGIVLFAQEPEAHQQFVMPEEEAYVRKAYQKCPVFREIPTYFEGYIYYLFI